MYLIIICNVDYYEELLFVHWVKTKEELDRLTEHYLERCYLSIRVIQIEGDEPVKGWFRPSGSISKTWPLKEELLSETFDTLPWDE